MGRANALGDSAVAELACNTGQSLQMVGTSAFRRQKQKHQVNRLIIESIEIDWFFQLREQSYQTVEPCQLAMRDRNAVTDTCRAQTFALKKRVEDFPFGKTGQFRRLTGEFLNCLFLLLALSPAITASLPRRSPRSISPPTSFRSRLP